MTFIRVGEALMKEMKSRAGSADASMAGLLVVYELFLNRDMLTENQGDLIKGRVRTCPTLMGALCGWICKPKAHGTSVRDSPASQSWLPQVFETAKYGKLKCLEPRFPLGSTYGLLVMNSRSGQGKG